MMTTTQLQCTLYSNILLPGLMLVGIRAVLRTGRQKAEKDFCQPLKSSGAERPTYPKDEMLHMMLHLMLQKKYSKVCKGKRKPTLG